MQMALLRSDQSYIESAQYDPQGVQQNCKFAQILIYVQICMLHKICQIKRVNEQKTKMWSNAFNQF